jgi:hypothetical protein
MLFNKASLTMLLIILLWISIAILGRIIPHPPNATPLAALTILSGYAFRKNWAILITLVSLGVSDILLALLQQQPMFGDWSLFTYSGFILVAYLAPRKARATSQSPLQKLCEYVVWSTFGYWFWTNFGTWLMSSMYSHDAAGFLDCYLAALPFLRNALLANIVYVLIFLPGVKIILTSTSLHKFPIYSLSQNQ